MLELNSYILITESHSRIVGLLVTLLGEVRVYVFGKRTILEGVCVGVVCGQRVDLHLLDLAACEVEECSVLPSRLALVPILHLWVAHPRC